MITLKNSIAVLLILGLCMPCGLQAQEDGGNFNFNFGASRRASKENKKFSVTSVWGFGPTFVSSKFNASNTYYPDFKPFSSWSNDLGILSSLRLGGENSPMRLNLGFVWRYINVETDKGFLDVGTNGLPEYVLRQDAVNTELNIHTLSIPLTIEFARKFAVAAGGFVAWRVGSNSEYDYKLANGDAFQSRRHNAFGLADMFYGITVQAGHKRARLFMNYYLNNLFANDTPYDFRAMTIGLYFQ